MIALRPARERDRLLRLTYRCLFYTLAGTPIWGAGLMLAIVWHHTHLS